MTSLRSRFTVRGAERAAVSSYTCSMHQVSWMHDTLVLPVDHAEQSERLSKGTFAQDVNTTSLLP